MVIPALAVARAMNDAALVARTTNPDIPDEEYDAAQALAAIRVVAEVMEERADPERGMTNGWLWMASPETSPLMQAIEADQPCP